MHCNTGIQKKKEEMEREKKYQEETQKQGVINCLFPYWVAPIVTRNLLIGICLLPVYHKQ
jgi:hypothetical protein